MSELMTMLPLEANSAGVALFNVEEIPKAMDIFFRAESSFLPEGKTFKTLTEEESLLLKSRYRFSPYRPGTYQGITGIGAMVG